MTPVDAGVNKIFTDITFAVSLFVDGKSGWLFIKQCYLS